MRIVFYDNFTQIQYITEEKDVEQSFIPQRRNIVYFAD